MVTTILIIAIVTEDIIHLGLAGLCITTLAGLLYKSWKYSNAREESNLKELNRRDDLILNMQSKTVEALTESTNAVREVVSFLREDKDDNKSRKDDDSQ